MGYLRDNAIALVIANVALSVLYVAFLVWPEFFINPRGGLTFAGGTLSLVVLVGNFVAWVRYVMVLSDSVDSTLSYLARIDQRLARLPTSASPSSATADTPTRTAPRKPPADGLRWPD